MPVFGDGNWVLCEDQIGRMCCYNELTKKLSYDLGHVSISGEASQFLNGSSFFRGPRNPTKLDYDPEDLMREAVDLELVPGPAWDIITDDKTGTLYYYNRRTKTSQWEHPHKNRDEAAMKKQKEAEKREWNQHYDDETDKPFWEHKKTGKVQWADPSAKKVRGVRTKWEVEEARRKRAEEAWKKQEKAEERAEVEEEWMKYTDDTGKPYWWNNKTGNVQWEDPHAKNGFRAKWQVEQALRQRAEAARKMKKILFLP